MAYARNNLDAWDPMAESYHDANINSYEHGPAEHLTPYARAPANPEYKLYVTNIPVELSETGIQQLFNRYGQTLNVLSPPDSLWAFVTFGSFREAETAMRVLNNTPPLNLQVSFAKIKTEGPHAHKKNSTRHGIPNIEYVPQHPTVLESQRREYISPERRQIIRPLVRNLGRGKEFPLSARKVIAPPPGPVYESDDLLYPAIHDPNFYNPYEEAEPFADTNAMWTRGRVQMSNDGNRYVTMGRGHTWYELPAPHPKVHQQIRNVYENREAGLYEFGENKFAQQVGKCQYCTLPASMRCQRCREFYCNRNCQETDWPRHKIECQAIPRLEGGIDSGSLSSSGDEVAQDQGRAIRSIRVPMRRPMATGGTLMAPNSTSTPIPIIFPSPGTALPTLASTLEPKEKENKPPSAQDNFKRSHSGDQKGFFDQNKPAITGRWNPMKNGAETQTSTLRNSQGERPHTNQMANDFSEMPPPVKHNYQQAWQESREMPLLPMKQTYQQARQDHKSFENRNEQNQNSGGQGYENQFQPSGVQQNKNFFPRGGNRGNSEQRNHQQIREQVKNLSVNDTEVAKPILKANNTENPQSVHTRLPEPDLSFHKARDIPENLGVTSPKVSFSKSSNDGAVAGPSGVQSSPKPVVNHVAKAPSEKIADKTQVLDPFCPSISSGKSANEIRNVVELLEVEEEGIFEAHVLLGSNKAAVTVCILKIQDEYTKISSGLKPECNNLPSVPNFKPSVGDFVCGKRLDDWIRGTVTSLGPPIRLAAVDEGRVEPVQAVRPVPSGFVNLPMMGAVCELTEGSCKLQQMEQYTFVVEKVNPETISQDGVQVAIYSADEKEGKGILKPWTPAPEQKGVPYATLTSGTEVCLVSFRSHTVIFARSCVPKDLEDFERVTQDVARWSTKASPLTSPPVIGEMVIAKYAEDGNFYRAIVRKIAENNITVSYVDFGNIETVTLEKIRPISPNLKEYPSCVAKIMLKDVPKDVAMNKEVNDYLVNLAGNKKELMCTFKTFTDGVVLKAADGTCVNDKIKELLNPSWKKEKDETTVFVLDNLPVAELGAVGASLNVFALFSYGPLLYAMAPQDLELIGHIQDVMAAQMDQYCKQCTEHYIPRQNELCLALFEGQWYRAVCLETNTTPTTSTVNYVDFGNIEEIKHTDIRMITKDFTTASALASVCTVVGLGPVDRDGELPEAVANRVKELVPPNSPVLVKIVECTKLGEYTVELPEVREVLEKEGLLKV